MISSSRVLMVALWESQVNFAFRGLLVRDHGWDAMLVMLKLEGIKMIIDYEL